MSPSQHSGGIVRTPELVLLGGPHSGKTHYAGQLYGRVRRRPGLLRLRNERGTPSDLSALEEVLRCLEEGRAAEHTSSDTWAEVSLPLEDKDGNTMDLRWPDYGGEQIRELFNQRAVPEAWRSRLTQAEGWVLLIRLKGETTYPDALSELTKRSEERTDTTARAGSWDANARWVELLQLLLHVAGLGQVARLRQPRLAVLLSAYDELGRIDVPPRKALAEHLPLVSSFLESTWTPEAMSIWGLSALGRPLETNGAEDKFIEEGPEFQGWVISPEGGPPDSDLSSPLAWLVGAR
jgi:Double-GTPase 1